VFAGAPYIERLRANKAVSAALAGVTAAVVGVIANLALWFALHFLFGEVTIFEAGVLKVEWPVWGSLNIWALILSLLAAVLLLRFKLGLFKVLGISLAAGMVVVLAGV
jgi:chromate transporter